MRQIILDTETTGLDPSAGHRLVEIGCIEVINFIPTGKVFHQYINPERDMPIEAQNVHGLSAAFLKNHPVFAAIVSDFLDFIGDSVLVIHNADFDMKFINAELRNHGFPGIEMQRVIDTLKMARQKFPGAPANLDALCKRFNVDASKREKHGALLDAELLSQVYVELTGGKQAGLALVAASSSGGGEASAGGAPRAARPKREFTPSAEEIFAHDELCQEIKNPIWRS